MKMANHSDEIGFSKNGTLFEAAKYPSFLAIKMSGNGEVCMKKILVFFSRIVYRAGMVSVRDWSDFVG